ncbi:MAG: hypothetical protein JZD40_04830 [Sulfolobus sp.]|nr:hypothetical protein [Sulfolobus sp.]
MTLIELIWTITPALILIAIAFPSFKLLYLMDLTLEEYQFNIITAAMFPVTIGRGKIFKNKICTEIVVHGNVGSSIRLGRMTQVIANFTVFPMIIVSQLVGHLLGDGRFTMSLTSTYTYFVFTQTIKRFYYIWVVFTLLSHYCNSVPLLNPGLRKGTPHPFMQVLTRSYPYFVTLFNLFYVKVDGK